MSESRKKNYDYENHEYLVSIYMTTYFHESYIVQAIDSILSQEVNFDYEIIICDDCSQDSTQEIIKRYGQKYPFIRYKFNENNIGLTYNMFQAKSMCRGKYIVTLSGDDYWIDNQKLQKQVDFLEMHKEFIGVATRIEVRTEYSKERDFIDPSIRSCNRAFTLQDFLKGKNFHINGFMMRNVISEYFSLFSLMPKMSLYIDDVTDCILILRLGDIYIMDEITVAYRRRIEGVVSHNFNSMNKGITKLEKSIALLNNLYYEFGKEHDLFGRYKIALGPEIAKHYRRDTKKCFKEIIETIPDEYRKRGLVVKSILYNIPKTFEVFIRSHRK